MKKLLLSLAVLATALMTGAQTKVITCASLNVDGMPPSLLNGVIKLNPDSKEGEGASAIGNAIASKGWDVISLSEDFNYHNELMEPLQQFYAAGTFRGKLTNKLNVLTDPFDTDGLGFLWAKNSIVASNESWTRWNKTNGKTDQGSDELIKKGFRYYCVDLGDGIMVDFYIHHMDAETNAADIAARESQMEQLVNAIRATDNHRPIIIMGDTNCRYTRDRIYELLIQGLNADPRFTCHDPWVDFNYDGKYDEHPLMLGDDALMTWQLGFEKGEVVDKILYVENNDANKISIKANSITHATDFCFPNGEPFSDHFPVVVEFTIERPFEINGSSFYLRNVATGKYLNAGSDWGTHAILDDYGYAFTFNETATDSYKLKSPQGWMKSGARLDGADAEADVITLQKAGEYYNLVFSDGQALSVTDTERCDPADLNANDTKQQWELVTYSKLVDNLKYATADNGIDATFFIKAANFNNKDSERASAWSFNGKYADRDFEGGPDTNKLMKLHCRAKGNTYIGWDGSWTCSQTITGLPSGKYHISFNCMGQPGNRIVKINDLDLKKDVKAGNSNNLDANYVAQQFSTGEYRVGGDLVVTTGQIEINLGSSSHTSEVSICYDDFRLTYYGPTDEMLVAKNRVQAAVDDARARLANLTDDAKAAYNNNLVESALARNSLSADGRNEVELTYQALAKATKQQNAAGADMTYAIMNWSFEMGWMEVDRNLLYWPNQWMGDTGAKPNSNGTYYCDNTDGDYLFNTWGGDNGSPVGQDVTGLPNGIYELSALVTSDAGNKLYVYANGVASEPVIAQAKDHFEKVTMRVSVIDGKLTLGACAMRADDNDTPVLPVVSADELWGNMNASEQEYVGAWYKADDFHLTLVATAEIMFVQQVIDDATARAKSYGLTIDLSAHQEAVDNLTVTPLNYQEHILDIYEILGAAVRTQTAENSDYTYAITNPSFEMAQYGFDPFIGWEPVMGADTKVVNPSANAADYNTYGAEPIDGKYLFNTWTGIEGGTVGEPISGTIKNLPAGHYSLTALIASDADHYYFLIAGDNVSDVTVTTDLKKFVNASPVEFDVLEDGQDVVIGVRSSKTSVYNPDEIGEWYKVDNFRLTLVNKYETLDAPEGSLDEDAQELTLTAAEGASIYYAVTFDGTEPAEVNTLYTGPIDLNAYLDDDVYVWAMASQEGFISSEVVNVLDGYYVAIDPENTVIYSPVTDEAALTNESWYIIVANHAEGHHAMGADHKGAPVQVNSKGNIVANEALFADVVEFQLLGDGINWTMNAKNGEVTLGPVAPASSKASAPRAAGDMTISLGSATEGATPANITWADGSTLGFHHDAKEFGYTQAHSAPVMLYTTGKDMNTGVGNVAADDDTEVEYYNLQGVRIMNPGKGLYIRRQGNKATKVVL